MGTYKRVCISFRISVERAIPFVGQQNRDDELLTYLAMLSTTPSCVDQEFFYAIVFLSYLQIERESRSTRDNREKFGVRENLLGVSLGRTSRE